MPHDEFDLVNRLIRVQAKTVFNEFWQPRTKRNRVVPISDALSRILRNYKVPATSVWFFSSPRGKKWGPDNFSQDLRKVNKAAGLDWSCLDFRHTFGSNLAQKGESLYKIAELMRNSPEICRKHYAALLPEKMADVVEFSIKEKGETEDNETKKMFKQILDELKGTKREGSEIPHLKLVHFDDSA